MSTRTEDLPDAEALDEDASVDVVDAAEDIEAADDTDDTDTGEAPRPTWFRRHRRLLAAVVVVLLALGGGAFYWYKTTVLPAGTAFRLGDSDVTITDLNHETDTLRALYGIQAPTDPAKLDTFRRDVAKSYAVSMILDNAATDHKIVIADKMAQDTLSRFVTQQFGDGSDARDKFVQALGTVGTTEQAVLVEIKRQLAVNQLFEQVAGTPAVSDTDVQTAFAQRKDTLGTPERRDIHNIVVSSKAEADQAVTDLKGGATFETIAQQRSLDASTKTSGGDLGAVSASQLDQTYAGAAFTTPMNTVFGPVQTQYGWNVGKVVSVMAPIPAVFDQVKDNLKQQLVLEQQLGKWRGWLGDTIKGADVKYADVYRPANPDAAPDGQPGTPAVPVPGK
ncbi:MAG: parvulin peptidyl-prolyl isomerase [Amycolatopsis sp.]|uniref:peptidylprolyl isomerase n=1 Tax=Amycolatopsis sp. TaxID=37632 RepID=UPI002609CB1D|nr:peptidyl-prolyl cis-trans isomerase [Amycolatopsis sp.]MCU1679979.1 parvulin peptidyl-prolyl isomerase [Amycolatopsis sp.]